ncbi:GNAT family N-acetyltransferase [Amaricoccus sp.]|uniref:GNAT family N-acetyltransferase n=1 Tax=Amaricoccus sp. TaxID=1872485 RepID=UPI0025C4601A|nr:GNAT family N-acetyltransferase [Amaricoccus sp.]
MSPHARGVELTIRRAMPDDALSCAQLLLMAAHGMAEAVFSDLVPGLSTEQIIASHRIEPEGRPSSHTNWWVVEGDHSDIAGGMNAYALREVFRPSREEVLTDERIRMLRPMIELNAEATGTFYINALAVFPEYRHAGFGRRLIALAVQGAREAGMAAVSLTTFEDDRRLVSYYRKIGFAAVASRPLQPHARLQAKGNVILMKMPIDDGAAPSGSGPG